MTLGIACPLRVLPLTPNHRRLLRSGATHEETGLQRNGIRSSLATNPYSISTVMTILFVCEDSVVNASILSLFYRNTPQRAHMMVWGAIAYNTRSPLALVRGTMIAQRYVHDILQPHVLPLMQRLPGAIFQEDSARPHMANVSQDCLRTVTTLPWPSRSPDLSPIAHIWDHLGWRVGHPLIWN
ncbi:transposable element Tcb2 transposase [Trichonephila clavipes]|nr:transposable element Tcb2 transposase [Trichonephila clavipes]